MSSSSGAAPSYRTRGPGNSWDEESTTISSHHNAPGMAVPPRALANAFKDPSEAAARAYTGAPVSDSPYASAPGSIGPRDPAQMAGSAPRSVTIEPPSYPPTGGGAYVHANDSTNSLSGAPQQGTSGFTDRPMTSSTGASSYSPYGTTSSDEPRGRSHKVPKRPGFGRENSDSWARLLQGAGYAAPEEKAAGYSQTPSASQSSLELAPKKKTMYGKMTAFISLKIIIYLLILGALWVPGIVALLAFDARPSNDFDRPTVWHVGLFWWSTWLSSVFVGLFLSRYIASLVPFGLKILLGRVLTLKNLVTFLKAVQRYFAIFIDAIVVWVLWLVLIWNNYKGQDRYLVDPSALNPLTATNSTTSATSSSSSSSGTSTSLFGFSSGGDSSKASTADLMITIGRFWFALVICAALLLIEKLAIQAIALSFHRISYAQRLQENKFHIKVLVTLFEHSRSDLQRRDTSLAAERGKKGAGIASLGKRTRLGVRRVTRQSASVLGSMAEEIMQEGTSLNPFSAKAIVISALGSSKETRKLARRLFYSFSRPGIIQDSKTGPDAGRAIRFEDIAAFFPDKTTARAAYEMLDKDSNGSTDRDECEMAVMEVHRERLTLSNSMSDVDSAVSNLDGIFMSFYTVIALVIIAALLSTKFQALVTSFSTTLLALSWALGATVQEVLASVLFVFCKHPLDVGDHVAIPGLVTNGDGSEATFIVQELQLLSTVLKTTQGKVVQTGNFQLAQKPIINLRRSGPIEEPFSLEVAYDTSYEQLEELRHKIVEWTSQDAQRRDFLPGCNISIDALADQSKLKLSLAIRYKSNWQHPGIKARRRNRWVCELKDFLHELKIYGPKGDPDAIVIQRVAMVDPPAPAEDNAAEDIDQERKRQALSKIRPSEYVLFDELKGGAGTNDVYGERTGVDTPDVQSRSNSPAPSAILTHRFGHRPTPSSPMATYRGLPPAQTSRGYPVEDIELGARPTGGRI